MFLEKMKNVLAGPAFPERDYTLSGQKYAHIYAMAADLRHHMKNEKICCLFTEDRGISMAAVLAALETGTQILLPYSFSQRVLEEIREKYAFHTIISHSSEKKRELPKGVQRLIPHLSAAPSPLHMNTDPDAPLIIFFTGGSTGKPKIWSKTPRNLFAETFYHAGKLEISPEDRFLSTVPPCHIYGFLFSLLLPFVSSASVHRENCTFPEEIRALLQKASISILVSLPIHYRALKDSRIPENRLRIALSSAGKLEEEDGDCFYQNTGTGPTEIYGSTETGGIAYRCRAKGENALQPFDIIDWKIKDEMLYVRSDFLSPGTARDAAGYFRTGDRVCAAEQDGFQLLGRADGIVKVGGKRVDTDEVRETLKQIPGIADAVVISLAEASGRENILCALLEGKCEGEILRQKASGRLPAYAVPRIIRFTDEIPRTSAGKYDRQAILEILQHK